MRKTYILDANVLLHDPTSLTRFEDNNVIIPLEVIGEIDRFKRETSSRGQNARQVSRLLDSLRNGQSLAEGVTLDNGVFLRVYWDAESSAGPAGASADSQILRVARRFRDEDGRAPVIIVSKDINLRIQADAMGLAAQDYETDRVILDEVYKGHTEINLSAQQFDTLASARSLPMPPSVDLLPNQYALVRGADSRSTVLARAEGDSGTLIRIRQLEGGVCGIMARNKEQFYAVDALLDDRVRLVTLMGKAGTGKTLLALASALHQTLVKKNYLGVVVARPTVSVGRDIGFLPGDLDEKMSPWMTPITDTVEYLFDTDQGMGGRDKLSTLLREGIIEIQPLSLIRGRSINNRYMVVDEAQNLSPLEVKTIITRVGLASKIVLTGDPYQIDNPYVDSASNGFNYLVNRFRGQAIAAHVELAKGERSELAELAANLL